MIYLDNAATTQMKEEVYEAMLPYLREQYGNASAIYDLASSSKRALENARAQIADLIHAKPNEIIFTSGGTESDNWALKGIVKAYKNQGKHIITSQIEHLAILNSCNELEELGYEVTYLPVDEYGFVHPQDLRNAIRKDTILVSIMMANNEIGTIEPIKELAAIAHEHHILFHTDAVQSFGQIPIDVEELQVDLLSASAHKIYGPKGAGCLFIRNSVKIHSLLSGGSQERNRRAGTENISAIVGFGKAAEIAKKTMQERMSQEQMLRDYFISHVLGEIAQTSLNGATKADRLPNNCNIAFAYTEAESVLIMLDMEGICASAGSACTTGSIEPSHVLLATGQSEEEVRSALRFTISDTTTKEELDETILALKKIVSQFRSVSALFEEE